MRRLRFQMVRIVFAGWPTSLSRLFSLNGTDLWESRYAKFTQQLAALIVKRTHLPLLDFRLEEKKQKQQASTLQHLSPPWGKKPDCPDC